MSDLHSILTVDVDDSAFKRHHQEFQKYAASVNATAKNWKDIKEKYRPDYGKTLREFTSILRQLSQIQTFAQRLSTFHYTQSVQHSSQAKQVLTHQQAQVVSLQRQNAELIKVNAHWNTIGKTLWGPVRPPKGVIGGYSGVPYAGYATVRAVRGPGGVYTVPSSGIISAVPQTARGNEFIGWTRDIRGANQAIRRGAAGGPGTGFTLIGDPYGPSGPQGPGPRNRGGFAGAYPSPAVTGGYGPPGAGFPAGTYTPGGPGGGFFTAGFMNFIRGLFRGFGGLGGGSGGGFIGRGGGRGIGGSLRELRSILRAARFGAAVATGGFGLNTLVNDAYSGRRTALGLGTDYGSMRAFDINAQRVVDARGFMEKIAKGLSDPEQLQNLYGVGLRDEDLSGKRDPATLGRLALLRLKSQIDQTPEQLLGGLPAVQQGTISVLEARRLRNTSRGELEEILNRQNAAKLNVTDDDLKRWQDFKDMLSQSGRALEATFIKGLIPLIGPIGQLTKSFEEAIAAFMEFAKNSHLIEGLGQGIKTFAEYLGSPEFKNEMANFVKDFAADIRAIGIGLHQLAQWLNPDVGLGKAPPSGTTFIPDPESWAARNGLVPSGSRMGLGKGRRVPRGFGVLESYRNRMGAGFGILDSSRNRPGTTFTPGAIDVPMTALPDVTGAEVPSSGDPRHNPGNLRIPGSSTGFQSFRSDAEGIQAIDKQLQRYYSIQHLDTLRGILNRYSPASENPTSQLIANAARRTGYDPDEHLAMQKPEVMADVITAILKQERARSPYTKDMVLKLITPPGSSPIVSAVPAAN